MLLFSVAEGRRTRGNEGKGSKDDGEICRREVPITKCEQFVRFCFTFGATGGLYCEMRLRFPSEMIGLRMNDGSGFEKARLRCTGNSRPAVFQNRRCGADLRHRDICLALLGD